VIRAGKLHHTILLQRSTETIDAAGVPSPSWSTITVLRAEVVDLTAEEEIRACGASSEASVVFRTWWSAGVELADRILFHGEPFNIRSVKEIGRRRHLEIRAEKVGV
jgi:SPP1 family predicted phage head-tail adaptor